MVSDATGIPQDMVRIVEGDSDRIAKGGGKGTQLPLPASSFGNPTAVAQAIKAALQKQESRAPSALKASAGRNGSATPPH